MSYNIKKLCNSYGVLFVILGVVFVLICVYVKPKPRPSFQSEVKAMDSRGPSLQHEQWRRKLNNDVQEWWIDMKTRLANISQAHPIHQKFIKSILTEVTNYYEDLNELSRSDRAHEWRDAASERMGRVVQERIHTLQNPPSCHKTKRILCDLTERNSGFGHYLHYIVYCMMLAHTLGRTMVLKSVGWRYESKGWNEVFLPLSDTCTTVDDYPAVPWSSHTNDSMIVAVSIAGKLKPRPKPNPNTIPEYLAKRIKRFHGDPLAWWVGQYVKFATLLKPSIQSYIDEAKTTLGYRHPIVGVHVGRSDRVAKYKTEYHSLAEYMTHVREFHRRASQKDPASIKRVYLATDDTGVAQDLKKNYTDVKFITDTKVSQSAELPNRYSKQSLIGAILDIQLLSLADYIVCDISSNLCRVAYELKQTRHGDASRALVSLGRSYLVMGADNDTHQ